MQARRIPVEIPLGRAALGVLAGVLISVTPWAGPSLLAACVLIPIPRSMVAALAVVAGLLMGAPLRHAPSVVVPGAYSLHGTVRYVRPPRFGRRAVHLLVDQVGATRLRAPARATIDIPAWAAGSWPPHTRVVVVAWIRRRSSRGWEGHAPHAHALVSITPPGTGGLQATRQHAAHTLDRMLPSDDAGVLRAMLLGDRAGLSPADKHRFRASGQAHLLAVSGLHVGLWIAAALLLLRWLGVGPRMQSAGLLVVVAIGVPLAGAPLSAVRAGSGAALYFAARLVGREPSPLVVLSIVALAVCLLSPAAAFDPAFRLSFGAVLGILTLTHPITMVFVKPRSTIPGFVAPPRAALRRSLAVSCAAWLGTVPFVLELAQHVVPASPLVAVVAIPLTGVVLLAGGLALALGWIPLLAAPLTAAAEASLALLRSTLDGALAGGVGPVTGAAPSSTATLLFGAVLVSLSCAVTRRQALRRLLIVAALVSGWLAFTDAGNHRYDPVCMPPQLPLLATGTTDATSLAILGAALVALGAFTVFAGWLTRGGAACAVALGMLAGVAFGAPGIGALMAPFLVATLLGKLPGYRRAGARSARQVWSNGIPAAIGALIALVVDPVAGLACFLGGLSCLGADTCATEIGVRFGGTARTLTGKRVARGESGGVTLLGTLAAVGGSTLAPVGATLLGSSLSLDALCTIAAAGVAGAILDSWLGAVWQFRGRSPDGDHVVEDTHLDGAPTQHVRGWRWLDNDRVNLLTGLASGVLAIALWHSGLGGVK